MSLQILSLFTVLLLSGSALYSQSPISYKEYLMEGLPSKREIDVFLTEHSWAKFDSEVGYTLGNYLPRDGMDGSSTISTSTSNGIRTPHMYTDQTSRINTYGNSFTQCHQVSDGETWQEYLAAHFGEPIRNFGMGGFGVYQAYRRMLRAESSKDSVKNIILYIWGDDHIRSLLRCRYMLTKEWRERQDQKEGEGIMFHGNFWANLEMDLKTGAFVEYDSRVQSEEELYKMLDPEWMYENLKTDWALQMYLFKQGKIGQVDLDSLKKLAAHLDVRLSWESKDIEATVTTLLDHYSFEATKYILSKTLAFAEAHDKNLLVVIFNPYRTTRELLAGSPRYDQTIVDFLEGHDFHYFDANLAHVKDYKAFKISVDDYYQRYFIGHYNPTGNHFFAYKIRPYILEMLDPKPITYTDEAFESIDFEGYLER